MQIGDKYKSSFKNTNKNAEIEIVGFNHVFKCDMVFFKYIVPEKLAGTLYHNTEPFFNEIFIPK